MLTTKRRGQGQEGCWAELMRIHRRLLCKLEQGALSSRPETQPRVPRAAGPSSYPATTALLTVHHGGSTSLLSHSSHGGPGTWELTQAPCGGSRRVSRACICGSLCVFLTPALALTRAGFMIEVRLSAHCFMSETIKVLMQFPEGHHSWWKPSGQPVEPLSERRGENE